MILQPSACGRRRKHLKLAKTTTTDCRSLRHFRPGFGLIRLGAQCTEARSDAAMNENPPLVGPAGFAPTAPKGVASL